MTPVRRKGQQTSDRNGREFARSLSYRASICLLLLIVNVATASSQTMMTDPRHNWLAKKLEKHLQLQESIDGYVKDTSNSKPRNQSHRRQAEQASSPAMEASTRGLVSSSELPQRVRIEPFDLLLAPTPIQLKRADEDLLLVELQALIVLLIKTQFGHEGRVTNRMGTDTNLEYVLFSDIEENSWSEGRKNEDDPPRTVMRFNGGVASFLGPDTPSEENVNEWTMQAVNELFVAALTETSYNYIEMAQYMAVTDPSGTVYSGTIDVTLPSKSTSGAQPIQQNAIKLPDDIPRPNQGDSHLFHTLVSLLVVFSVIAVVLALWIRNNNRAVRVLCLSSKEREEIVDFSDDVPIEVFHEKAKPQSMAYDDETDDGWKERSIRAAKKWNSSGANSLGTNCTISEGSQTVTSEFTVPTVSALSFRNPNPFAKGLVAQESFQKERKTHIAKDMLYSSWSGKPPNLDHTHGRGHDDSVLQPSYFSAAKEWEHFEKIAAATSEESQEKRHVATENASGPQGFKFEAAHEYRRAGQTTRQRG